MSFRGCFFEYDGVYSGKYNLRLAYVDNQRYNFSSGGEFDFKFGQIPFSHEQLYYGKDYSENPLQFEIEIINPDNYISEEQMREIKEWLFGRSGWKKFKVLDGRGERSLRCILIPIADITEGNYYRGLRFTLRNASSFWYGEEKEIVLMQDVLIENSMPNDHGGYFYAFNIPITNNNYVDSIIYPIIEFNIDKSDSGLTDISDIYLATTDAKTISEALSFSSGSGWSYDDTTKIICDISYMGIGNNDSKDVIKLNTKYATLSSQNYPNQDIFIKMVSTNSPTPTPMFKLNYGNNICRIRYSPMYTSIIIKYTPMLRMGAF